MTKNKMLGQAQLTNMELCPKLSELVKLCPIEVMLISQTIPFMLIVTKTKVVQQGPKR